MGAARCATLVFALDADAAGQQQWRALARQAALRGKRVAVLAPAAYGGYKDVSAAWTAGVLALGAGLGLAGRPAGFAVPETLREVWAERVAIMVQWWPVPPADAERLAWVLSPVPHDADGRGARGSAPWRLKNSTGRQTSLCSAPGRCSARRKKAPPLARPRVVARRATDRNFSRSFLPAPPTGSSPSTPAPRGGRLAQPAPAAG